MDDLANDLSHACAMIDNAHTGGNNSNRQIRPKSAHLIRNHPRIVASVGDNNTEAATTTVTTGATNAEYSPVNHWGGHVEKMATSRSNKHVAIDPVAQPEPVPSTSGTKPSSAKSNKPERCASILLRSKGLILSDSDSEVLEEGAGGGVGGRVNVPAKEKGLDLGGNLNPNSSLGRRQRGKKHKRKSERHSNQLCVPPGGGSGHHCNQYFGKRKRSTSLFNHSVEDGGGSASGSHNAADQANNPTTGTVHSDQQQRMDCDSESCDSSSLSESIYSSDQFLDADDEQSDFYEVMARTGGDNVRSSSRGLAKSKYQQSIPIPKNPFASVPSTPSSSCNSVTCLSSALIWKRRRKNH